jgi:hypothetical protein
MALLPLIGGIASGILGGINKSKQLKKQQKANEKAAELSFKRQKEMDTKRWKMGRSDMRLESQINRNAREQSGRIDRQAADQQQGFTVNNMNLNQGFTEKNMGLEDGYTRGQMNLGSDLRMREADQDYGHKAKFAELQTELENRMQNLNQDRARASFDQYGSGGGRRRSRARTA